MKTFSSILGGILAFLLIIALIAGLSWGGWALKVALSDTKGKGDAIINKNDAVNRVNAQERFESLFAEVTAADQKVAIAAQAVAMDPSYTNKTNLTGVQSYCLSVIADYNAEARKFSARDFRATDLPAQIDTLSPSTDCKEN